MILLRVSALGSLWFIFAAKENPNNPGKIPNPTPNWAPWLKLGNLEYSGLGCGFSLGGLGLGIPSARGSGVSSLIKIGIYFFLLRFHICILGITKKNGFGKAICSYNPNSINARIGSLPALLRILNIFGIHSLKYSPYFIIILVVF
jgi:hypothetical protein